MMAAPKWYEKSIYKLYVCPVSSFDQTSLTEVFSQYAEIVDVFISPPNDNGFKWAFVYFATEEGLLETVRKIEESDTYSFKLSRAKPKTFIPPVYGTGDSPVSAKLTNGFAKPNGVSYVAPPNCVHCKKLTFQQCVSCKNPFCSTECALDGWRSHTSSCVKVAELVKVSESNVSIPNALAPTVVNFMKDCKYSKKKFTSDEFADACTNYRGLLNAPPAVIKEDPKVDEFENPPLPEKRPQSSFDKSTRCAASFRKPPQPVSDNEEEDPWGLSNAEPSSKTSLKRTSKRNSAPSQHKPNHKVLTDTEDREDYGSNSRRSTTSRKPNRKYFTDNEDAVDNANEKSFTKPSFQRKHQKSSETEEPIMPQNGCGGIDKSVVFKKKFSNEPKRSVRSTESKIIARMPQTDLKMAVGDSVAVIVTSIVDQNTFFVANADKVMEVLKQIMDCHEGAPSLDEDHIEINILCLAFFDGAWYRARVLSTDPIEVEYIDYGNKEPCKIENLKVLPASLKKYLPLATRVQLKTGDILEHKVTENEDIEIYVNKYEARSDTWIVDVL